MEEFLTPRQAAERKGISVQAIYKAVREDRLPSTRWMGRIGLRPADVNAFHPASYGGVERTKKRRGPGRPAKRTE